MSEREDLSRPSKPAPHVGVGMRETARWGVLVLAAVLAGGHAAAGFFDKEWWPLSHYGLYAREYRWRIRSVPVAFGLTHERERVPLDASVLFPLDDGRIERLLRRGHRQLDAHPEGSPDALRKLGLGFAELYVHNRREGSHAGPVLHGVEVVLESRQVRADASNADGPADRVESLVTVQVCPQAFLPAPGHPGGSR